MVYVGRKETGYRRDYNSYWADESKLLPNIVDDAKHEAQDQVNNQYPYAVYRTQQEVTQFAEQIFQLWQQEIGRPKLPSRESNYSDAQWARHQPVRQAQSEIERWNNQLREMKRVYVSTFIGVYQETLAKKDEAARPKVQPQPVAQSATPSNTATLQGAKITLTRVERKTNEYIYHFELVDPENFDGVERTEWVVYFEGASVPATEAATPTAAYGISSSDVAFAYGSPTSQKSARKPKGSYLRKP